MTELHNSKKLIWFLIIVFTLTWLYVLGWRTLVPPDEGRYAEMAREMWQSGDWITPRLNGIKYFEKPPLQTWMNALTFAVFGLGEWQARLWTGLCGLLSIALTAYAGLKIFGRRSAWNAALILGSSIFWVAGSQFNSLDMSVSAMLALSLFALLIAQRHDASARERRNWMLVCWAGMALAVLAKGLIGVVLPGAVLVLYTIAARDWGIWKRLHLLPGLLLFFAIGTPWFVLVWLHNPEHPHFFFVHEHWDRFFLKDHHRAGPWYYFFAILIPGMLPWTGVLGQSLLAAAHGGAGTPPGRFRPKTLLLVWIVFIFFFFSYSNSKLPGYILPVFPAIALLIAVYLDGASRRQLLFAAGLTALLALIGLPLAFKIVELGRPGETPFYAQFQPWVIAACGVAAAAGLLCCALARSRQRDLAVLVLALGGFLSTEAVMAGYQALGRERAGAALAPLILAEAPPGTAIYSVSTYEQSLTFYLRRTVTLVDYLDEFSFGLQQQPQLAIASRAVFLQRWRQGPKAVAIVSLEAYRDFVAGAVPMRVITRDSRRVVIANNPVPHSLSHKAVP
jgi:4-amino-4-deoxy-L-arabinose transferase-like glycosyltransferase